MGAILLWLAEQLGGAVLKHWFEGLLGRKAPAPDPKIIAEASRADAKAAQAEQIAQANADRAKVDQQVMTKGADAARQDMAKNWNQS